MEDTQVYVEVLVAKYQVATNKDDRDHLFSLIVKEMLGHLKNKAFKFAPGHDLEDRFQRYSMALVRAADTYKPATGVPFTAWFHLAADNERKMMWRESQTDNRTLNYQSVSLDGIEEATGADSISGLRDDSVLSTHGYIEIQLAMETMELTQREREVADGYAAGLTRREIARKIGVGDSRIGYILKQLERKFSRAGITLSMITA